MSETRVLIQLRGVCTPAALNALMFDMHAAGVQYDLQVDSHPSDEVLAGLPIVLRDLLVNNATVVEEPH